MSTPAPQGEDRIELLLATPDFPPPAAFAAQAEVADAAIYERAAVDPDTWWADQARQRLDWDTPFTEVLDDSDAPFYRWFADGTLNVSYNCLDRHVEAGLGDRVAFHWHGEEGEQRDLTYAELLADVQRLADGPTAPGGGEGGGGGGHLPVHPDAAGGRARPGASPAPDRRPAGGPVAARPSLQPSVGAGPGAAPCPMRAGRDV